jgi:tripartite-type tricarboxylate transporter receptor subunit TctC
MKRQATTVRIALLVLPALALTMDAFAQGYPAKPIRYIVPFPPGGGQDLVVRALAPRMTEALGQTVVVDNRPGAATMVGAELAAKSPPDGYTVFNGSNTTLAINPNLYSKVPYDPIKDFAAVTQIASLPNLLVVHPSLPVRTVKELAALARSRPGQLNYGSSGTGTPAQLAGVMFGDAARAKLVHVPYRGSSQALTALISGETQMMFGSMTSTLPFVKSGRLRAIAVTGAKRSLAAPDLPTVGEAAFPGFEAVTWYGLFVPAGTPAAIVARLNSEVVKILRAPDFRDWLIAQGADPVGSTPDELAAFVRTELVKYAKIVKDSGMRPD